MDLIKKILPIAVYGITVLMLIITFSTYSSGDEGGATDVGLYTFYGMMILGIVGIIIGFVLTILSDPKSLINTIVPIVALLVVWGICYSIAGSEVTELYKKFDVNAALSQMIGSVLNLTYALLILAAGGIIFTEVSSAIRS